MALARNSTCEGDACHERCTANDQTAICVKSSHQVVRERLREGGPRSRGLCLLTEWTKTGTRVNG